jgi:uncharacterized membrane protein SpoIIM required for sporulation
MRQVVFAKKNEDRWRRSEAYVRGKITIEADELATMYIDITDDLSYAKTFYPQSTLVEYLNGLAFDLHNKIYRNKKEKKNRILEFWKTEVPLIFFRHRSKLLWSAIIFVSAIAIGLFSASVDDNFLRLILGDSYVNMTMANIEKGDPMAVYKGASEGSMFFGIGINNVYVSFLAFALGILASVMTGYILFVNGVMVGAFIYFFVDQGLFVLSFTTIFIHGTLELSAIVIAGAAGIVLGNSWVFPGTYGRGLSLKRGARDAIKMIIGLVPVFIAAALLESFVTRHYLALGLVGRLIIIVVSAAFILWYFVIYPARVMALTDKSSSVSSI